MYRIRLRPRRRASSRRRKNPRTQYGTYRPVIHYGTRKGHGKHRVLYRAKGSRFFKSKRRLTIYNPRRRRRNPVVAAPVATNPRRRSRRGVRRYARHSYRRNPKFSMKRLPFGIDKVAISAAKIAGGMVLGMLGIPLLNKAVVMITKTPSGEATPYRKLYGVAHVIIGAIAAASFKNKNIKDAALVFAGVGVYDLISQNIPIGLPKILDTNDIIPFLHGDEPGVIGMGSSYQQIGADYAPAFGASYQETGADDISYGGDALELD